MHSLGRSRAVLLAATIALVFATTGLFAVLAATPAQAHSSTITVLRGQVFVSRGSGPFLPIADGDLIAEGDSVRTAAGSFGVLTLFDGTTVELEPNTQVTVTSLQASASGDKIVELTQAFGRTWHAVTHLASPSSRYLINTTASTAAVRGTAFAVEVLADGRTRTTTTEGDVAVIARGREVHVLAGQETTVTPGSPPPPPQAVPEPAVTVSITLGLTRNAIVTDANGRAVGVQNGLPIRYIPGSKVEVIDGRLVVTIPDAQLGTLNTFIRPDVASGGSTPRTVTIETRVGLKGLGIVANTLISRPVQNGTAKGAVLLTATGLLLVPTDDPTNAPDPHIGQVPAPPAASVPVRAVPVGALVTSADAARALPAAPIAASVPAVTAPPAFTTATAVPVGFAPLANALVPALPTQAPAPGPTPALPLVPAVLPPAAPTPSAAPAKTATPTDRATPWPILTVPLCVPTPLTPCP